MNIDFDITIIGGGVIGLACARALSLNHSVLLVEQHEQLGSDTSSRNSEVIHAGLYYKEGSLKETLCVAGRQQLYRYCEQYNVPFRKTGKLIVAANATGHSKLDTLFAKGQRLNIPLQMLDQASLKEMEPTVAGYAALFSPETGIIDSHTFMRCLAQQSEQQGALVMKRTQFIQATLSTQGSNQVWSVRLNTDSGPYEISTRFVINAAGLYSHKVAMACGANAHEIPPVYYCRGHYFNYQARSPFQHLVYPLPDEQLAGLGIHATLDLNNQCRFGPDAEYLSANIIDYKMNDSHRDQFIDAIRRYFPDLRPEKLEVGYAGIRPKLSAQGEPAEDFQVIEQSAPSGQICGLHLYGIESPGLTSSLALAELIQERVRFSTFL